MYLHCISQSPKINLFAIQGNGLYNYHISLFNIASVIIASVVLDSAILESIIASITIASVILDSAILESIIASIIEVIEGLRIEGFFTDSFWYYLTARCLIFHPVQ